MADVFDSNELKEAQQARAMGQIEEQQSKLRAMDQHRQLRKAQNLPEPTFLGTLADVAQTSGNLVLERLKGESEVLMQGMKQGRGDVTKQFNPSNIQEIEKQQNLLDLQLGTLKSTITGKKGRK